jgi:hypothetical protein
MRSHLRSVGPVAILFVLGACSSPSNSDGAANANGGASADDGGSSTTSDGGVTNGDGGATTNPDGGSGGPLSASPMFGFSESATQAADWPDVHYGMQRFWDSPPYQWPSLNPSAGVFDFTNIDADLALALTKGTTEGLYTLARTPPWATSAPGDTSCNYPSTSVGGGNGECDAPSDLNADGSGTNAIWKAWITAIATHMNDATYLKTHAHIRYWEIWNEPDTKAFYAGSIAQLARMTEDANCIITGRGVVHDQGNGTATKCTATPIDPTAQIVMSSGHAAPAALPYAQNQLYCSASPTGYQLPCPNPPDAIAAAVDIINFHMKPGASAETTMKEYVDNIHGLLKPAELAKPLWDGEASFSSTGWTGAYTDADMAASFMPRFWLTNWSLGISGNAWYSEKGTPDQANVSLNQTISWMAGATLTSACAATGTVYSCGIQNGGKDYQIMWDSSQSCSGGSCTTKSENVDSKWTTFQDMTTASTAAPIANHAVLLGIKPIVLAQ